MRESSKWIIAIVVDLLDLTLGLIPAIGHVLEFVQVGISMWLWGGIGLASAWEIIDFSNGIDAFIPTVTLIGLIKKYGVK